MKRIAICMLITAVLSGCGSQASTVVLDGWWNTDYAKNACSSAAAWYKQNSALIAQLGCNGVTSCQEQSSVIDACRFDPSGGVVAFQHAIATEVASNPACHGVNFVQFSDPRHTNSAVKSAVKSKHWWLQLDFVPGASAQSWSLLRRDKQATYTEGAGTAKDIAAKVCAIAGTAGGNVAN
jgi:hypothetical protein